MPPDDDEEIPDILDREALRPASEAPVSVEESQQKRWPDLEETTDAPEPALEAPAAMAGPLSDKTERLDDVIAKLRAQPAVEPVPAAPPPQPVRPPEATPEPKRATGVAPAAQSSPPARKLVVYGGAPPPAIKAPPRPSPPRPAPPAVALAAAPVPDATGRRIRWIGVGLIVAAIVLLFAAVLWILVSLVRGGASGATPRSSRGGSSGAVARAAHSSVDPTFE